MNEFVEKDNFESKLQRVRRLWIGLLLFLLLLLTLVFLIYINSLIPEPPSDPINHEVAPKPFPRDLAINASIVFIIGIVTIIASSGMARSYHSDKLIQPLFVRYNITKTKYLSGIVTINSKKEVQVNWSAKGYFILTYEDKPVAHAKSTELYWKILYLRHMLDLND